MSTTTTFRNKLLNLYFNNTGAADIGDATGLRGSTTAGSVYISLHSADPGIAGSQTTSEISYTGYARVAVGRGSAFTVSAGQASNNATITFGACTAGTATPMFFGIGSASSGAGTLDLSGPLGTNLGPFTATTADNITFGGLSGVAVDDRIVFFASPGSMLPTGMTEGTVYWVKTVSGDVVTIAATQGGTVIDLTTAGDGIGFKVSSLAISAGITPSYAASALSVVIG